MIRNPAAGQALRSKSFWPPKMGCPIGIEAAGLERREGQPCSPPTPELPKCQGSSKQKNCWRPPTPSRRLEADQQRLKGVLLGHRTVESSVIGPHRQTYALTHQVSRGGAAAHFVPSVQQGAVTHSPKQSESATGALSRWLRSGLFTRPPLPSAPLSTVTDIRTKLVTVTPNGPAQPHIWGGGGGGCLAIEQWKVQQ